MVQDQWPQQKVKFLLGYYLKIIIQWGQWTFGGGSLLSQILASEEDFPPSFKQGKPCLVDLFWKLCCLG